MVLACAALGCAPAAWAGPSERGIAIGARADAWGDPLPAGALARLGTGRLRQVTPPRAAVFSPDAGTLFTTENHRVRAWDVKTGREVRTLEVSPQVSLIHLAMRPDGKLLAGCTHQSILLWDPATGEPRGEMALDVPQPLLLMAFAPDGKTLAVVGSQTIARFDPENRAALPRFPLAPPARRCEAALRGEKPLLAVHQQVPAAQPGERARTSVRLLDFHGGAEAGQFELPAGRNYNAFSVSADGKRIALGAADKPQVEVWDMAARAKVRELADFQQSVSRLEFSPDGKRLAVVAAQRAMQLWNLETGEKEAEIPRVAHSIGPVFSPDARLVYFHGQSGRLGFWDVAAGRPALDLPGHEGLVRSVRFSPDGKRIVTGSADRTAIVWDVKSGRPERRIEQGNHLVDRADFSPDGKLLAATGAGDRVVRLWDPATGDLVRTLECGTDWVGYAFFLDGGRLATAGQEGNLRGWSLAEGKQLWHTPAGHRISPMAASPDGRLLATASWLDAGQRGPQAVRLWDTADGKLAGLLATESPGILALEFSPCGRWLAASGVYRHEPRTDPRGATYSDSMRVEIFELLTGQRALRFETVWARALAFSPDGRRIAAGSERSEVQIHSAISGAVLHAYPGHPPRVDGVAFSPDGRVLASGGGDGTVLLWDADLATAPPGAGPLAGPSLDACWDNLAAEPLRAYAAMWRLAEAGPEPLAALGPRVKPCQGAEAEAAALLEKLKSDAYSERMRAVRALEALASEVSEVLEESYQGSKDADFRFHLKRLLGAAKAARLRRPELCRACRLAWVCEKVGGQHAETLLKTLAQSPARLAAAEAKAALARMAR